MNNMSGFPIAMCYVPWQAWERTYEPAVALKRGTIFPSLDLPFLGGGCRR
ncbi:MAG: spore coat associated protein CotJA [Oscillospiraceae bacterium]|nr:spore coat associated protein CotJA [Oscillospiraceae bacterium]